MANTFITPSIIAREALMVLENQLISPTLMSSSVASEFTGAKVGTQINVRRPTFFATDDFNMDHGTSVDIQNIKETQVPVTIEHLYDVSFEVTNTEMSLKVDQFRDRLLVPAMAALSQKIDVYALSKVKDLGGLVSDVEFGNSANTPYGHLSTLPQVAKVPEKLNIQQVPMSGRKMVITPKDQTAFFSIDAFARVDHRGGATSPVIEANLGRFMGMDVVMSQNLPQHTTGAFAASADATKATNGDLNVGDTTVTTTAVNSSTVTVGDTIRITYNDGVKRDHTITTAQTASGTAFTNLGITPPIYGHDSVASDNANKLSVTSGKAVEFISSEDGTAVTHDFSGAWVPDAFQLIFVPQSDPMGPGTSAATVSYNGMSLRVLQTYDHLKKKDMISIDCLVGAACVDPRLGAKIVSKH